MSPQYGRVIYLDGRHAWAWIWPAGEARLAFDDGEFLTCKWEDVVPEEGKDDYQTDGPRHTIR